MLVSARLRYWLVAIACIISLFYVYSSDLQTSKFGAAIRKQSNAEKPYHNHADRSAHVAIFLGIFSTPERSNRRQLLRDIYGRVLQAGLPDKQDIVVIKHIIGESHVSNMSSENITSEQDEHGDLLVLDMEENMDDGKTWHYFTTLAQQLRVVDHRSDHFMSNATFDFVMKLDDDTFLNVPQLLDTLRHFRGLPEVYFGRICNLPGMPTTFSNFPYHCGSAYALSPDLCQWLLDTYAEPPPRKYHSAEDVETAGWLVDGQKTSGFVAMPLQRMYSFWDKLPEDLLFEGEWQGMTLEKMRYTIEHLDQRDIAVHGLKDETFMRGVADWFYSAATTQR